MKTLRMFGIAVSVITLSAAFTSCSKEDVKNEDGVVITGKKLTEIAGSNLDFKLSHTCTFSYDSKGRLIESIESEKYANKDSERDTCHFIWGDGVIKVTGAANYRLILENGLVQRHKYLRYEDDLCTYNQSNRLVEFGEDGEWLLTLLWDEDQLTWATINNGDTDYTFTYGQSCKKGYFPFFCSMMYMDDLIYMAHPELIGMRTDQIPSNMTKNDKTSSISYQFDQDGYITRCSFDGWDYNLTWK